MTNPTPETTLHNQIISAGWQNFNNKLTKTYKLPNFASALAIANQIGAIAEKIGHHPEISFTWGKLTVQTTTHDQGNTLTEKDYQLAKLIEELNQNPE